MVIFMYFASFSVYFGAYPTYVGTAAHQEFPVSPWSDVGHQHSSSLWFSRDPVGHFLNMKPLPGLFQAK
jgi:hypothetical protein